MIFVGLFATVAALDGSLQLREAQARSASAARAAFTRAVAPEAATRAWELAALICTEERHSERPESICAALDASLDQLAEAAGTRLRLAKLLGGSAASVEVKATAVSTTLFGTGSAPDDEYVEGYFRGNAADYYDPFNSYVDVVLQRRQGIPITLSLVRFFFFFFW